MSKTTFKDYICKPHCVFFKDGEKEDMACHGAVISERLVQNQTIFPHAAEQESLKKDIRFKNDNDLIHLVCANCPFEKNDCDFRSSSPPEDAIPCGGYIFLFILKSQGKITIEDLRKVCVE